MQSLKYKLNNMYAESIVYNVKSMACLTVKNEKRLAEKTVQQ